MQQMNGAQTLTADQVEVALEKVRERLDIARREQFLDLGVPLDCYWPASRLYHRQSSIGPATKFRMTLAEVAEFTRRPDYKRYPGADRTPLPRPEPLHAGFEKLIRERRSERTFGGQSLPLETLAKLLELSCGVTADLEIPGRAAPSPGGLYAVEAYPLVISVDGLAPGVYHYAATEHVLELVRPLSNTGALRPFLPPDLAAAQPPLLIALSVVFPRVQTKYLERGYRFALLEAGHIGQNLLLAATALGMNSVACGGFWDEPFNDLLEFDTDTEAVVYSVLVGRPR